MILLICHWSSLSSSSPTSSIILSSTSISSFLEDQQGTHGSEEQSKADDEDKVDEDKVDEDKVDEDKAEDEDKDDTAWSDIGDIRPLVLISDPVEVGLI